MLGRRLMTIPGYARAWAPWLIAAPVWLPGTTLVDLRRRSQGVAVRSAALLTFYVSCEMLGMVAAGALVSRVIRVHFRRISRSEIPIGCDARIAWLLGEWQRVNARVEKPQSRDCERP